MIKVSILFKIHTLISLLAVLWQWLVLSSDPSLNPHLLVPVFTAISGEWEEIWYPVYISYTTVPEARAALFREKFRDGDQVRAEAGKYYALYHHDPSWKDLSLHLYSAGETKAVEIAKPHVQTVTGMYNTLMCTCV